MDQFLQFGNEMVVEALDGSGARVVLPCDPIDHQRSQYEWERDLSSLNPPPAETWDAFMANTWAGRNGTIRDSVGGQDFFWEMLSLLQAKVPATREDWVRQELWVAWLLSRSSTIVALPVMEACKVPNPRILERMLGALGKTKEASCLGIHQTISDESWLEIERFKRGLLDTILRQTWSSHQRLLDLVVEAGVDVNDCHNAKDDSVLFKAIQKKCSTSMIQALLRHGADPDQRGWSGRSSWEAASHYDHAEAWEVLWDHTPAHQTKERLQSTWSMACREGAVKLVHRLMERFSIPRDWKESSHAQGLAWLDRVKRQEIFVSDQEQEDARSVIVSLERSWLAEFAPSTPSPTLSSLPAKNTRRL